MEDAAAEITTDLTDSFKRFFNSINRGRLWQPTPAYFKIGILCWRKFAELLQNDLKKSFLNGLRQRGVFTQIVNITFYDGTLISQWYGPALCHNGHNLLEGVSARFYNCMCKNLVRDLSARESNRSTRKIQKLCGEKVLEIDQVQKCQLMKFLFARELVLFCFLFVSDSLIYFHISELQQLTF